MVLPIDSALADLPRISVTDLQDLEIVLNVDSGTTTSAWGEQSGSTEPDPRPRRR